MPKLTVEISDEEEKALLTDILGPLQPWLTWLVHNKADQCINQIVKEYSDKQAEKIPRVERLQIVKDAKVKSKAQKQAEFEESLKEKPKVG